MKKSRVIFTLFLFILGTYSLVRFLSEPSDSLRSPAAIKSKSPVTLINTKKNGGASNKDSNKLKPNRSSLALYIEGNLSASFEQLGVEIEAKSLTPFQIEQSLERLPYMYKGGLEIRESDVIKLLQTILLQNTLSPDVLTKVEVDIETLKLLGENPTLNRLFQLNDELKKRGADTSLFVSDLKRVSFLTWSQKFSYRKWAVEQGQDSALDWLYFSGFTGYQNFLTGVDDLQEYVARCEGKKIPTCRYVREAIQNINLAHDLQKTNH